MRIQHLIQVARLIAKDTSNQISPEEKERLESWKNESKQNLKLYDRIVNWDNFQERNREWESIDADHAWEQFSARIEKERRVLNVRQILIYAAAIMLPLLVGGTVFYYLTVRDGNSELTAESSIPVAAINPGTQNAVIILDNGKSIDLENAGIDQLVEKDGSVITNENGQLKYSESKKSGKEQLRNTLIVPRGGEYTLVLSDGSRVFLNSVSKLVYPVVFDEKTREVSLEGEAYFEIEKDASKPFIVNVEGVKIEVLGTSFNVKAYSEEASIFTTLVEGKVKLNTRGENNDCILLPDQQAVIEKSSHSVAVNEVDVQQFIGWKNGLYSFADQPIEDIMRTLARWYDFEYEFASDSLKAIHFEGGLNKYDNIYPVLDIMQGTGKLKYKIEGKKIIFM
ncbi:DUF4974 domain-containing protein [Maribellus sp. CM-23]|nr:DUF4974 domain-containing protein [Maribellus sp. CM-23]